MGLDVICRLIDTVSRSISKSAYFRPPISPFLNPQNTASIISKYQLPFDDAAKEEIFAELAKDYISGITLSGGDPLYFGNRSDVLRFVRELKGKFPEKTVWLYTGFVWETISVLEIMDYIDVLVDGEFQEGQKNAQLYWRGSANQRVINVPASRAEGKLVLHCR